MGRKFKSFTDINNYNNFLLDLDKKQSINDNNNNDIPEVLKNIDKTYHSFEYNSNNFTGANNWERIIAKLRNLDPNLYEDLNTRCDTKRADTKCADTKCADTKCADTKCDDTKKKLVNKKEKEKSSVKEIEPIIKHHVSINVEINNIGDLLELINQHPDVKETKYNINMKALHKIKEPLTELNNMIGMKSLKENIVDQILFYIQNLHKTQDKTKKSGNDFMHTVIYGPPGTGKTEVAKIMGQIFSKIGILEKGTFKKVTRSDLVAGYLGQTAIKTTDVIKECLGGVLFIDEAYALGNPEKRDIFSKECIDTLCEALSNYKDNLMVIIAGYETDLNECFFNYNQGLNSRFTWRFKTDDYSAEDLYKIFIKKVYDENWSISENENEKVTIKWFEKNKSTFRFYGRDIETLFAKIKIAHSRRVFCLDDNIKKILIIKDINKGLEMFIKNENSENKRAENLKKVVSSMYL
jgi:Holliday junction resolvasome RuvABC ATP-dependent DNA helicase subunit